jgi:Na+/alanine symporter
VNAGTASATNALSTNEQYRTQIEKYHQSERVVLSQSGAFATPRKVNGTKICLIKTLVIISPVQEIVVMTHLIIPND